MDFNCTSTLLNSSLWCRQQPRGHSILSLSITLICFLWWSALCGYVWMFWTTFELLVEDCIIQSFCVWLLVAVDVTILGCILPVWKRSYNLKSQGLIWNFLEVIVTKLWSWIFLLKDVYYFDKCLNNVWYINFAVFQVWRNPLKWREQLWLSK